MIEKVNDTNEPLPVKDLHTILKIIKEIRHGSVNLIIQDEFVIQIDKHEKIRLK
ncbi:YezD family protein [Bacillota bacterium LX-D]|nr:YezD family protein [Bacillota bacterium LX-D]